MDTLIKLINFGQSYWLDNLTRGMINSGELKKRVTEQGLRGMTSNPAIFNKAISNSSDYDEQIAQLVEAGKSVHEIYDALTIKDVQDACDILRPVFDSSQGVDGFVSLEVSPYLGHDTNGTMSEARRLFKAVNRPNVFIKIPGTPAGVPAIEQMLYEGININITLLFSIRSYEAVAEAYLKALERRLAEDQPIQSVRSVASFFLSRIDVLVDQLLGHRIIPEASHGDAPRPENLLGKVAVANAKLAYVSYKRIFSGNRWKKLADMGARVQRPLWASTSTKDPLYSDVKYVEPLIGPDTVNTMPESTIAAFADHGVIYENSIEKELDEARQILDDLKKLDIDIDFVTDFQLVNEGIQKFIDPYNTLMTTLAGQRQKYLEKKAGRQKIDFGKTDAKSAFVSLDDKQFARRVFEKDPYLWKSDEKQAQAIRNRLGWLNSVNDFAGKVDELSAFANEIKNDRFSHVVLLGMGGSSLCPEVARETFGSSDGFPQLLVLDSTDPEAVKNIEDQVDLTKTLFIVASKSGTTTETISYYKYFYDKVKVKAGEKVGNHFVAVTDPGTPLVGIARDKKFRRVFENPQDIGGRYSALSYFGLLPMALIGINIRKLLENANQIKISCGAFIPSQSNPGVSLGVLLGMQQRNGRDKVTFVLSKSIYSFGYWVEQLIAESTGKEGVGLVPVESEALADPQNYSADRVFAYLFAAGDEDQQNEKKLAALEEAGHPVVRIEIKDKLALGAEFFRWELATATAGKIIGINPFDEPNVAEAKNNTKILLDEWKKEGALNEGKPVVEEGALSIYAQENAGWLGKIERSSAKEFLQGFIALAKSPDYLALLSYVMRTPARHEALQKVRHSLRDKLKVATTLGYGPRYLHSTGQLHKGGANTGVFIILTADSQDKLPIAGEQFDFATLHRSKALGDYRSLNDHKRRVIRIHLGSDVDGGLKKLAELLK